MTHKVISRPWTDPAARVTSFTRNAVGRPLTQTLPDGRLITFTYDANGNLTSLSPPARPAHNFTFTPIDLMQSYLTPPVTGGGTNTTTYTYDLDRKPTRMTRPDGQEVVLTSDSAGRVISRVAPTGTFSLGYDSAGRVQSRSAPAGANLTYSYDGALLTQATVTGPVPGTISWTYDPDFRPISQSVNGSNSIAFSYDDDRLLTSAGDLTLSRDPQNGLLTDTTLDNVSDTVSYNLFAEPSQYEATVNGNAVFSQQYTRDALGRLTTKTETVQGVTDTYGYTYDLAGRLIEVKLNGVPGELHL